MYSRVTVTALVHAVIGALLMSLPAPPAAIVRDAPATVGVQRSGLRMVFVAPPSVLRGSGGGGGGNRRRGPIPRAQALGRDPMTLPLARSREIALSPRDLPPPVQELVIEAKALASGMSFLAGLPDATSLLSSDARGAGSGTGFGEGNGSGIGSGSGPGVGPGSGGGAGGGAYRPGGAGSAPVLLTQIRPTYTAEALRVSIQGSVVLELIVRVDGMPDAIRVVRSLDPGGLDEEAVSAVRQWRFQPGRLGDTPVDVLVTVIVDFHVH